MLSDRQKEINSYGIVTVPVQYLQRAFRILCLCNFHYQIETLSQDSRKRLFDYSTHNMSFLPEFLIH